MSFAICQNMKNKVLKVKFDSYTADPKAVI